MAEKLKKRADGRLVKTITDPRTGKRIYFYGKTEREINHNTGDGSVCWRNYHPMA